MPLVRVKASGGLSTDIRRLATRFWMMYEGGEVSHVFRLLADPTKRCQEVHCPLNAHLSQAFPQRQTVQTQKYLHPYLWDNMLGPTSLDSDYATSWKVNSSKPASYPMGNVVFPRGKAAGAWRWALNHAHQILRLIISGVKPPLHKCGQEQTVVGVSSSKLVGGTVYRKCSLLRAYVSHHLIKNCSINIHIQRFKNSYKINLQ